MAFKQKNPDMELQYGMLWWPGYQQVERHRDCIQRGGRWKRKDGEWAGEGNFFHYKGLIKELWPEFAQHRWFDIILKNWLDNELIGIAGSKDSGKSGSLAVIHLADYYCYPHNTAVVVSSTTKEALENRIFGEIVMRHKVARRRWDWIPGNLIQGRLRIVTDNRDEVEEGRDFRCGFMGMPVRQGDIKRAYELIIGIKNKRKRWLLEECQTLPASALDGAANFFQTGSDTKVSGTGNPSDIMDAHGRLCEPHSSLGGWESNIDAHGKTQTWRTQLDGICVHLPGSDSPNMDVGPDEPVPFPYLITRERMEKDARRWTKTDWHYQMFDEGRWPRGEGASRVITRQMCLNGGALGEAKWANNIRVKLLAMDAGFGGDRCVCHELWFGEEMPTKAVAPGVDFTVNRTPQPFETRHIIALVQTLTVPISGNDVRGAEDQIVLWLQKQAALRGIPADHVFVEPGMRTAFVQKIADRFSSKVVMLDFGGRPSDQNVSSDIVIPCRDYYFNFVTELWYSARLVIDSGQFRQLDEETMREGCMREYTRGGGNKIQIEPKDEFKAKAGFSPDRFDALVTGIEGARRLGFQIKRQRPDTDEDELDDQWKRDLEKQGRLLEKRAVGGRLGSEIVPMG
jgi:hypothetical protein